MSDNDTLSQMFKMHIDECDKRDVRNQTTFTEIKQYFKGIWDTIDRNREEVKADRVEDQKDRNIIKEDLKKLEIRAGMFLGGLLAIKSVFDYLFLGHK